ncbi:hypothetical protein [Parafrankia elaeagni]|uniref:hypothetical protein n=1 Tax=Parafrankia elaeagni TaxID=222534 RepID=UPI00036FCD27|nr:hypothetical protein [Parafrankia elaeagni]
MDVFDIIEEGFRNTEFDFKPIRDSEGYGAWVTVPDPFDCPLQFDVSVDVVQGPQTKTDADTQWSPVLLDVVWHVREIDDQIVRLVAARLLTLHAENRYKLSLWPGEAGRSLVVCEGNLALSPGSASELTDMLRHQSALAVEATLACECGESLLLR